MAIVFMVIVIMQLEYPFDIITEFMVFVKTSHNS
jgi:hypothetical protein